MSDEQIETVKARCPKCNGERVCLMHAQITKPWSWYDGQGHGMDGSDEYSLLECRGCETVFYQQASWHSEDVDYGYDWEGKQRITPNIHKSTYPKPESRRKPTWLKSIESQDQQLADILLEMYTAYDNDSYILTAIGLRTALDRSTELVGIDADLYFHQKLDALVKGGWIGDTERKILDVVTNAGNAAAHRAWKPDDKEIEQLLAALEVFLQRLFIVGQDVLNIKESIPPGPRKKPKGKAEV